MARWSSNTNTQDQNPQCNRAAPGQWLFIYLVIRVHLHAGSRPWGSSDEKHIAGSGCMCIISLRSLFLKVIPFCTNPQWPLLLRTIAIKQGRKQPGHVMLHSDIYIYRMKKWISLKCPAGEWSWRRRQSRDVVTSRGGVSGPLRSTISSES